MYERIFSFERGQVTPHLNVTFEKKKNPEGYEGVIPVDLCEGQGWVILLTEGWSVANTSRLWYNGHVPGRLEWSQPRAEW